MLLSTLKSVLSRLQFNLYLIRKDTPMIHKNILFCILFLVSLLGSSHSETHNWAVNLKLPYSSNFTGISKADSLNIMACANFETYPSFRQIIKTTNGGITWKMVYNFNDNNLGWFEVQNICYPSYLQILG